jgi:FKBP-type peptidyl-prolyl cis-trans isomerase
MNLRLRLPLIGAALLVAASAWAAAPTSPTKVDPKKFKTTKSGLKYAILKPGKGASAKNGDTVSVHYTGWLQSNGKKFDSSLDRGEPYPLTLPGQVIDGWNEGIPGMKVGEKRQLVIPAKLAYGEQGRPGIPGGATLIFDVQLVKIGR